MDAWVLTVGRDGRVIDANRAALRALGMVRGQRCCDVLRIRDLAGATPCFEACAGELATGGRSQGDRTGTVARDMTGRVVCDRVGDIVVVSVLPIGEVGTPAPSAPLTAREREVLALVAEGMTNARIARRLKLSAATVRTHLEHVRAKLGVHTRAEAVARAIACGEIALL